MYKTEKTVNGVTTDYHLVNGNVTYETNGSDKIYYTYDNSGNILSMNLNGTEYYYLKNAQGDIIGLTDNTGTQVVSYSYDSWGKLISIDGTLKDTVGVKNPYRYRSYRYDTETGLYYLQSRYYNPEWGRFLNADVLGGSIGELLSHNIFAYCKNNAINMEDPSGYREIYTTTLQDETSTLRHASFDDMAARRASNQITNARMKDLGYKKWRYRHDPADDSTRENEHVHLEGDGKKYQQDEFGNRRRGENSPGNPPQKAKDALRQKEGWDWDANAQKVTSNEIATGGFVVGGGYVIYRVIRIIPSLAPPFWWTIPENLMIP